MGSIFWYGCKPLLVFPVALFCLGFRNLCGSSSGMWGVRFFEMIFSGSGFSVADNSGAKMVRCVKVIGSFMGVEGSTLVVSISRSKLNTNLMSKGKIFSAIMIQCSKPVLSSLGVRVSFSSNSAILIKKDDTPMANSISKTISFSLRKFRFTKIVMLAPFCL